MDLNSIHFLVTVFIVFIGGIIQGTVAFGMGIFIVISLAWLFPSLILMPFTTLVSGVNLLEMARRRCIPIVSFFSPVLIFPMILGVSSGTWLLIHIPDWGVKLTLGAVVFLTGVVFTIKPPNPRFDLNETDNETWESWCMGKAVTCFFAGILGGWLSTAGPPVILYGYATMPAASAQRFLIRTFILSVFIKLFTYTYAGLWRLEIFLWSGVCIVFVLISTAIGYRIAMRMPPDRLSRIAWIAFSVIGFLLFVRTLFQSPLSPL
jgi:uncharacterized membrane protein YfcA